VTVNPVKTSSEKNYLINKRVFQNIMSTDKSFIRKNTVIP